MKKLKARRDGGEFEDYIQHVYRTILQCSNQNCNVEKRKRIIDSRGIEQEIDVYYELEHLSSSQLSTTIRVAIECKNWRDKVPKRDIQSFATKVADIPNVIPVFISANGYQAGAEETAKAYGITLYSEDDLPHLSDLLILQIKNLALPSSGVNGEPFWILMYTNTNGSLSGEYFVLSENDGGVCPLFLSRELANWALTSFSQHEIPRLCVRGLTRSHLHYLLDLGSMSFRILLPPRNMQEEDARTCLAINMSRDMLYKYFASECVSNVN